MKDISLFLVLIIFWLQAPAQNKKLLSSRYEVEELKELLISHSNWLPFPKLEDRKGWSEADPQMMQANLEEAEKYLDYSWPNIPATKSLLIVRTGDREEYQEISYKKRKVLGILLLAELYENKGRFIDPIIDGVWSICEESFWGVPAHLPNTPEYAGLMDVSEPFVDLFAAETGSYLAYVDYFLGQKLDEVSPQIRKRIYFETNTRLFEPLMNKWHFWMQVGEDGWRPNNWNPWISSNWINTALLLERDDQKRTDLVFKALQALDEFLDPYPQDGGCDEGPSYWGHAAASLYDNISLLNLASNDAFKYVYQDEKFKNMGKYIYRAQISPEYFLNFADAAPQPKMSGTLIYRYGKDIEDADMMRFGAYFVEPGKEEIERTHFFRNLFSLFMQQELEEAETGLPLLKDVWLSDVQIMAARDKAESTQGFYLAAKGGHNDESHNHNDIGNYVVYYDGSPLLIDVGRGTYTSRTFTDGRYEIWNNRSDYHNVPTVNGFTQMSGAQYLASQTECTIGETFTEISMDISKAYPKEAGINNYHRRVRLNRGKSVLVSDVIDLSVAEGLTQHLMTVHPAQVKKPGELIIHYKNGKGKALDFTVKYNPDQMEPHIEKMKLDAPEDKGIILNWGHDIYRINFEILQPKKKDRYDFIISHKG